MFRIIFIPLIWWIGVSLLFNPLQGRAQNPHVDSLQSQLKQSLPDTLRLKILGDLNAAFTDIDAKKKLAFARAAFKLAQNLRNEHSATDAEIGIGVAHSILGRSDSAIFYYRRAYDRASRIGYLQAMGRSLNNTGFAYDKIDNSRESLKCYIQALAIFKKTGFDKGINQCSINIGSIYFDLKQYQLAKSYYESCYRRYIAAKDEAGIGYSLLILGNCYTQLNEKTKAEEYLRRSLVIRQKLADSNGIALVYKGLGVLRFSQHRYQEAIPLLQKSYAMVVTLQDKYEQTALLLDLTDAYLASGQLGQSERSALQALAYASTVKTDLGISESLEKLIEVYRRKGDMNKAFQYQSAYVVAQDSLRARKALQDVTLIEYGRIRNENAGLAQENELKTTQNSNYLLLLNRYSNGLAMVVVVLIAVMLLLVLQYRRGRERRKANQLLRQQKDEMASINQVKNKLFSIISHDLRGPLANLQTLFSLYREGDLEPTELNELLTNLEDNIRSTSAFLDNLLEWSKNQLEGLRAHPVSFDVVPYFRENMELWDARIKIKKLKVSIKDSGRVTAFADPDMINLVIRNLLANSVKFCRPGDEIRLSAENSNGNAILRITDTGPGISQEQQGRLFSLDHTVSTGTPDEKGNHLGLILCRDSVEQNHGELWFDSPPGKGTTFWISLPQAEG
jgi:signal transduction histidine kinase